MARLSFHIRLDPGDIGPSPEWRLHVLARTLWASLPLADRDALHLYFSGFETAFAPELRVVPHLARGRGDLNVPTPCLACISAHVISVDERLACHAPNAVVNGLVAHELAHGALLARGARFGNVDDEEAATNAIAALWGYPWISDFDDVVTKILQSETDVVSRTVD